MGSASSSRGLSTQIGEIFPTVLDTASPAVLLGDPLLIILNRDGDDEMELILIERDPVPDNGEGIIQLEGEAESESMG